MEAMMMQFKDLQIIPFEEITKATNNFHKDNYLGGGGFGNVYKGELSRFKDRGMVAFKRLDRQYGQGETEFLKEISTLSQYKHENLIAILGYCIKEREMILAYEYTAHGSLDFHLGSRELTWTQRLKICLQAAVGLRYLHDPNGAHHKLFADVGLSKISPENANLVTVVRGTPGYTDPQYYKTYTLTEKSDVYSFGVTLFEVLCGRLCYDITGYNELTVFVHKWMKSYEQNKIEDIIFKELDMEQIDESSLKLFSDIAYKCLNESGEERPSMAEVVTELEVALETQEDYDMILKHPDPLARKYIEIIRAAVSPVKYRSIEELKECLSEGVLVNGGKTPFKWLSLNDKGENHVMISIEDYLILDDPHRDTNWSKEKSRFAVGCYKTRLMEFKLRVTAPLFLSPDVTYGLNLVLHASEIERMIQHYVGFRYKIQGETKISIMHFADKKEGTGLVAELYQFNSTEERILDLEIFLEDSGLSGDFYIEGIEFRPLGEWLSVNEKGEHTERIYIEACNPQMTYQEELLRHPTGYIVNSRFPGGKCFYYYYDFKARVRGEYLTPHISYTLNLFFRYEYESKVNSYNPLRYKIDGEPKVFLIYPCTHMREDGWFIIPLYHFTNQHTTADLQFQFEHCYYHLLVAGIEFQPSEQKVQLPVFEEYQYIIEAASQSLFYTSLDELKQILSRGIHLKDYKEVEDQLLEDDRVEDIETIFFLVSSENLYGGPERWSNDGDTTRISPCSVPHPQSCIKFRWKSHPKFESSFANRTHRTCFHPKPFYNYIMVVKYSIVLAKLLKLESGHALSYCTKQLASFMLQKVTDQTNEPTILWIMNNEDGLSGFEVLWSMFDDQKVLCGDFVVEYSKWSQLIKQKHSKGWSDVYKSIPKSKTHVYPKKKKASLGNLKASDNDQEV
ncbi:protein kinase-like domain, Phloem protein 2-like protein [Artemisia annua]|uniref:Protein kinase-like domain, Phloem protein 2-like protein n=1 Tax=Artemisia annua TaxID=35608 RepID=A0A2U1QCC8_ARTAN|nr:protein kinase-like domain, Phloem protein 2-like protein [Artemisia annua]